jgi:hypothetical protein
MGYGSGTCGSVLFLNGRCASLGLVRSSIVAVKLNLCELATSRLVLTTPALGFRLDAMIRIPCSRLVSSEICATNSISLLSFEWVLLNQV